MDKELRIEIKNLMKQGFPENFAIITACANQKKSELAEQYLAELQDENEEVEILIKNLIPLEEALRLQSEEEARIINKKTPLEIYMYEADEPKNDSPKCDDVNNNMTITINEDNIVINKEDNN